jgi:hypothetical protein
LAKFLDVFKKLKIMKRLAIILGVLFLAIFTLFMGDKKNRQRNKISDDEGQIDKGMTGPRGERIFIGAGGGRYFTKDDKKVYVGYKKKKKADREM